MTKKQIPISIIKILILLPLFGGLTSCATTKVSSLTEEEQSFPLTKDEKELWEESAIFEKELKKRGLIYYDSLLGDYVNEIGQKLIPTTVKTSMIKFRFQVINDPTLNAYALPNGSIYIHSGLLSRIENEAQLAFILGHEITHVSQRHLLKIFRNIRNNLIFAHVVDIIGSAAVAGSNVNYLGFFELGLGMTFSAAINGYGRKNEKEADDMGMQLMASAGYQVQEVPKVFELLLKEYGDATNLEIFFYGSHPANKERIKTTTELLKTKYADKFKDTTLVTGTEEFQQRTKILIRENAILDIRSDRYKHAIGGLEKVIKYDSNDPIAHYYLGESYRLMVKYPEKVKEEESQKRTKQKLVEMTKEEKEEKLSIALKEYNLALSYNPQYAEPHRGLGLLYYYQGKKELAKDEFEKYLTLNPMAKDKRQIVKYLEELKNKKEVGNDEVK